MPTWNYEVVHLHGQLAAHDDPAWVEQLVRDLTDHNESRFAVPWSVEDAPDGYVEQMVRGIVGVEMIVERLDCKRKLSQNRSAEDAAGVVHGLVHNGGRGAAEVAAAMQHTARVPHD